MKKYTTTELKTAWVELWNTDNNTMWKDINMELARRLDKREYLEFVSSDTMRAYSSKGKKGA